MLFEFGVTATVAILLSMVISFTLTPMMCSRLLRPIRKVEEKRPRIREADSMVGSSGRTWDRCDWPCDIDS